jgi:acyl carrier protein
MTMGGELVSFIQSEIVGSDRGITVDANTKLIDGGLIDSMGLMQIIAFVEERTGVRVPDDDVMPENFQTVASMERLIARLRSR